MAYGLCVQVLIMFMYNMFDFNDKILYRYDVHEGLFQCSYMYMYLSICVNEWIHNFKKAMSFHLWIGINYIQNSCNIYLPGNIPKKMGWLTSKET